eukprot:4051314-Amphidinium_carterae.1
MDHAMGLCQSKQACESKDWHGSKHQDEPIHHNDENIKDESSSDIPAACKVQHAKYCSAQRLRHDVFYMTKLETAVQQMLNLLACYTGSKLKLPPNYVSATTKPFFLFGGYTHDGTHYHYFATAPLGDFFPIQHQFTLEIEAHPECRH